MGSQESMNVPMWNVIEFQQRDRQVSQFLNNDTFCRLPVVIAQSVIGTEKYSDAGILLNYDDDYFFPGYGQKKEVFRALTKYDILQAYINHDNFRISNVRAVDVGFNVYNFDIRYQQNFPASQLIKVEFKFDGFFPNDIIGSALVLTNKVVSKNSESHRLFDLI